MNETPKAQWNGNTLTVERFHEWPTPHKSISVFERLELTDPACHYFVAADGETYGLMAMGNDSALCVVEIALRALGLRAFYATFALRNRTAATCKAWAKKWGKRTDSGAQPDYFSASVRFSQDALQTVNA